MREHEAWTPYDYRGARTVPVLPARGDGFYSVRQALQLRALLILARHGRCSLAAVDGGTGRGDPHALDDAIAHVGIFLRACSPQGAYAIGELETLYADLPVAHARRKTTPGAYGSAARGYRPRQSSKCDLMAARFPQRRWYAEAYGDLVADSYEAVQREMERAGVLG